MNHFLFLFLTLFLYGRVQDLLQPPGHDPFLTGYLLTGSSTCVLAVVKQLVDFVYIDHGIKPFHGRGAERGEGNGVVDLVFDGFCDQEV
jgi:hypothetical protein